MAYFQLGERQFLLKAGAQRVGPAGTGADVELPDAPANATAVVVVNADQSVVIRKADNGSVVLVNNVALGAEPSPLIHGDHVAIGGHDLRFGDTKQEGSTQFVSGADVAAYLKARQSSAPAKPTHATGGRLVSQLDGREYEVPATGLTIGRDPSLEIVIAATEVSRRHVHISPAETGYLLTDLSTNGVFVNGTRVEKEQILGRGDLIRVANEEFRFYADAVKAAPRAAPAPDAPTASPVQVEAAPAAPPVAVEVVPPAPPVAVEAAPPPPPVAEVAPPPPPVVDVAPEPEVIADAVEVVDVVPPPPAVVVPPPAPFTPPPAAPAPVRHAEPAPAAFVAQPTPAPPTKAPATARVALATLEVLNEGPDKGRQVEVFSALTNIGRGDHNDLVIANESVSDSHAKLQKRENGWFIVDIDSTNGTYVGGHRVKGEQALVGAPDLRFGDVKVAFRPAAQTRESGKSTRVIAGAALDEVKKARRALDAKAQTPAAPAISIPEPVEVEPAKKTAPAWFWGLLILVGGAILAAIFLRGA